MKSINFKRSEHSDRDLRELSVFNLLITVWPTGSFSMWKKSKFFFAGKLTQAKNVTENLYASSDTRSGETIYWNNLLEWSSLNMMTCLRQIAFDFDICNIERVDRLDFFHWKIRYQRKQIKITNKEKSTIKTQNQKNIPEILFRTDFLSPRNETENCFVNSTYPLRTPRTKFNIKKDPSTINGTK